MKSDRKYLVVVALLAVAALVFGVTGTVAPSFEPISPSQSPSESVSPYFIIPPNFDSGWVNITNKCGQHLNVTHNLNTTEVFIDISGKRVLSGGEHKTYFGGTDFTQGWSRTFGGTELDWAESLVATSDGGYAIAGYTNSSGAGGDDVLLIKTDAYGNMIWEKTYGGTSADHCYSVVQTNDGGYALAGRTYSYGASVSDLWLVKTDSAGNAQWNRTYDYGDWDTLYAVIQTDDGGYTLAGFSGGYHGSGAILLRTDATGNLEWVSYYGEGPRAGAYSLVRTSDGGYAFAGFSELLGGPQEFYLVKTDADGYIEWERTYAGGSSALSMVQTKDGGYALTGIGELNLDTSWLVVTDSSGNMKWNKTYDFPSARSLVQTEDEGYALAGGAYTYPTVGGSYEGWIVKTDPNGNTQWNKKYGGSYSDSIYSLIQTADGGYLAAGATNSFEDPKNDFWLVRTDVESGLSWTDSTANTTTLYRGATDVYWNFVRVRVWTIEEPTWQYGDINQDGVVDAKDLYILSRNYGKTFSVASLGGIAAIACVHTFKKRKHPNS